MQHSDERPPTSGRPSLLSLDQQAEADRHRILSSLENKPASTAGAAQAKRKGLVVWIVAGAAVLALAGGAGLWLVSEGEKEIVLAGSAPLPATPAPAAALATDAPVMRGTADEVSASAILGDAPVIAAPKVGPAAKPAEDDLTEMLDRGIAPAKPAPEEATPAKPKPAEAAVAKPSKPVRPVAKVIAKKTAPKTRDEASNVAPRPRVAAAPAKNKAAAKPAAKPAAPVDNDVALLAALVAHSKATQPKSSGAAAKLRQCKSLGTEAEAKQCRARVCAGAKSEPECKSSSLNKARPEG